MSQWRKPRRCFRTDALEHGPCERVGDEASVRHRPWRQSLREGLDGQRRRMPPSSAFLTLEHCSCAKSVNTNFPSQRRTARRCPPESSGAFPELRVSAAE